MRDIVHIGKLGQISFTVEGLSGKVFSSATSRTFSTEFSKETQKRPNELVPLVYSELRRLAAQKMAREAPGQTLQPTALVHEAWLRPGGRRTATLAKSRPFLCRSGRGDAENPGGLRSAEAMPQAWRTFGARGPGRSRLPFPCRTTNSSLWTRRSIDLRQWTCARRRSDQALLFRRADAGTGRKRAGDIGQHSEAALARSRARGFSGRCKECSTHEE